MINRAVLIGRLTRNPELKYTTNGVAVASFNLAVNRQFTNQDGEREADFINCVMWRKAAEIFCDYTHKGSLVGIDGRIQTRSYENQQGQRVYVTEVVADNFSFLESKSQSNQNNGSYVPQDNGFGQNNGPTTPNNTNPNDPFSGKQGQSIDITDEDLPF